MGKILALDIGTKRVGIAISDESNLLSLPYKTVASEDLVEELKKICRVEGVSKIVIGLPRGMDGTIGSEARKIKGEANKIKKILNLEVVFLDETATSLKAEDRLKKKKIDIRKHKDLVDLESAVIILEDYLREYVW